MEFEVDGDDPAAFFPVNVEFVSQTTLCGVKVRPLFGEAQVLLTDWTSAAQVLSVVDPADGQPVEHSIDVLLTAEDYAVV